MAFLSPIPEKAATPRNPSILSFRNLGRGTLPKDPIKKGDSPYAFFYNIIIALASEKSHDLGI